MGLFSYALGYARTRASHRLLSRFVGGPLSTALIAAWLGKKAYNAYRGRRTRIA